MEYQDMLKAKAGSDMIGALFSTELIDTVSGGFHSDEEHASWEAFTKAFEDAAPDAPFITRSRLEALVQNFGNDREEAGFRLGFHVAMRLCMEGLKGGAA